MASFAANSDDEGLGFDGSLYTFKPFVILSLFTVRAPPNVVYLYVLPSGGWNGFTTTTTVCTTLLHSFGTKTTSLIFRGKAK